MDVFIILVGVFFLLLFYLKYKNDKDREYFESKGIPYHGNGMVRMINNMIKGISFTEDMINIYYRTKAHGKKLAGVRDFGMVTLVVQDPELIKSVMIKDFDHFADRRQFNTAKNDFLFKKMLIAHRGESWKALRSKLSPTFTTGKIKRMFELFDQSGKKLVKYVENEMARDGQIELTEGYSKFTMDIIASAACGIDSQAFNQKEPSLFEEMGKKLQLNFGSKQLLKLLVMIMSPKLGDMFGFSFFDVEVQEFFTKAIKESINHRKEHNVKRDDFIQLMLEAREGSLKTDESELETFEKDAMIKTNSEKVTAADLLDDEGIAANAVLFILAGFDTTQSLLLYAAYSLALNQDVQDKLRAEVDAMLEENDGKFSYDGLNKINYMDMVINETLRFYPPAVATDRGCTMDYKVPGTDFVLKKGQGILVPIWGLHHDEEYFPNPEKFDPERFSPENKGKINQYAYMPFGLGPRNCIGMRFALAEVKIALGHLVHNFKIEPSKKTMIPMKFSKASSLKPEGGMWLALNKIHH